MEKFLTVYAVYDDDTQKILKGYQDSLLEKGFLSSHPMDVPFHITLGSFPTSMLKELVERMEKVSLESNCFEIEINAVNTFGSRVLFLEPTPNEQLLALHKHFDMSYPHNLPYHAHTTMLLSEECDVREAKNLLLDLFKPIKATIVAIEMGEFFPTRFICRNCLK
jgi:2'-5' RNA ligase